MTQRTKVRVDDDHTFTREFILRSRGYPSPDADSTPDKSNRKDCSKVQ
jgi:hypothetical protein